MDIPLRWVGALDADSNTNYVIESDGSATGSFAQIVSQDATSPYVPVTGALQGNIAAGATSLTMADATNFANNDYVVIDREMFKLGGKSGNSFNSVVGGQGNTIKSAHSNNTPIHKAHETYTHAGVSFGQRKCIRYHVIREQGSDHSLAQEILAVNPTLPAVNNLSAIWMVIQDAQGNPQVNVPVTMILSTVGNFDPGTAEFFYRDYEPVVTDEDGYFQFFFPRYLVTVESVLATVTIATGQTASKSYDIVRLPTRNAMHLLELV